ncbi:Rad52/Rad22 family DNA repair protein [Pseudohoeflea coraliihabitans]|uniref:Rad52/22 double-strand break repair protein n=1 Tax=Pseudohoeflea coraliihabitans TaxID=2860393 RepID=A0ABS6WIA2_9HYPH|nr:Rad52/Rad22 family DNA repair protein [Pseudohoeflea sp. DP4N28-3]MBW3095674.1 hypothetical protein [Pseudohoeflea sp. DP4N28-3]
MPTSDEIKMLAAEFPRDAVHWRAQSVTKDGTKAMALAYIDSRDVQDRLDQVCGMDGWQCRYSHAEIKTICEIGIKVDDEWIWKADGAGDTQVEAQKGAISDAFKRAAVKWGIGRYLYDMPTTWVPCECSEWNGKKQWKRWTADPWAYVKGNAPSAAAMKKALAELDQELFDCSSEVSVDQLARVWGDKTARECWPADYLKFVKEKFADRRAALHPLNAA